MVMTAVLTNHRMVRDGAFWRCTFCKRAHFYGVPGARLTGPCKPRLWADQAPIPQVERPANPQSANDWPCPTCGRGPTRRCRNLRTGRDTAFPHPARRNGGFS